MHSTNLINESKRIMRICNSCRYCEGFCAVFPAMELRRTFTDKDIKYMANLCHNCRDCYYACQYAPPHEFNLNLPKNFAAIRLETYKEFSSPKYFKNLFVKNGAWISLASIFSLIITFLFVIGFKDASVLTTKFTGEGSFYNIFPYAAMVILFSAAFLISLRSLIKGLLHFCRETNISKNDMLNIKAHIQAVKDAMLLKYLDGGGQGCNYPDDRFRKDRKWFHHLVFYGFFSCLASTSIAAFKDHFLHIPAPYPLLSLPVILGTLGGISMIAGTTGLFYLKLKMDKDPSEPAVKSMDTGFIVLLFSTALSGLILLALRETAFMAAFLIIHLGLVLALFATLPHSKFVHGIYRYMALVKNAIEQLEDKQKS